MSYKILELPYSKDTLEQYLNKNYTFLGFIGDKMIFKYKEVTSRQLTNKTNTEKFFELNDEWINNYAKAISERLELDFEFTKEEIVKLCTLFNARAGINLNRRNQKDVSLKCLEILAVSLRKQEFTGISKIYKFL